MLQAPKGNSTAILTRNLDSVRDRIAAACARCGRNANEILIVAVTKYVGGEIAKALFELGVNDLAESRPQELWKKAEAVPEARWHLVGHLQTNKVRRTLPIASLVHSIDRWELAEEISREAVRQQIEVRGLVEVKLTAEDEKHGFDATDVQRRWDAIRALPGLTIDGFMGMAALDADKAECRAAFAALRRLRDDLRPADDPLPILSMGMSDDFEIAIEEGATHVRIGSALFEGLSEETAE